MLGNEKVVARDKGPFFWEAEADVYRAHSRNVLKFGEMQMCGHASVLCI